MTDSIKSVLAKIPGWEHATWAHLSGGLSNRTWLVEKNDTKAVLKIDEHVRDAPYNSRPAEAQIQGRAERAGLANAVLFVSESVYMTEYLDGDVWSNASLDESENLDQLAAALRRLHALPLTGRTFDAVGAAHEYVQRIADADPAKARDCVQIIEAMPLPQHLCCCHNDLVAANIINTPELRFLDWEYACDNDPFFDLATIVAHHGLSSERADYLLNVYCDGDGKRWRERLSMQAELYEALRWLWEAARLPAVS